MQVLLDGHPLAVSPPSLAEALAAAVADAEKRGRIIVEGKADGQTLSDEKLCNPPREPSAIQELRLLSAEPRAMVRHTLLDAVTALENAREHQSKSADQIQSGQPDEALQTLQVAVLTWKAVRDIVSRSAAVLELDLDTLDLPGVEEGVNFKTATKDLLGHLTQMRAALDSQDWSALSDIVGYDLDAQVGVWKGLLVALSQHVSTLPPGPARAGRG